jgi:dTMP kinase
LSANQAGPGAPRAGLFIVFEGAEGSGKSTQARRLSDWLTIHRIAHTLTREPGGTPLGEQVRGILLHGDAMTAETELLLMLAARAAHVQAVIEPALARGELVVCDRYELSTFAYQGLARDLGLERVKTVNALATRGRKPDLTVVLDVAPAIGQARGKRSGQDIDRIERESAEFHTRVAEAYRLLASAEPAVALVDGTCTEEAVQASILRMLQSRFPETFPTRAG